MSIQARWMPGPLRPIAEGLLYDALNGGDNRAAAFFRPDDYRTCLAAPAKTALLGLPQALRPRGRPR